MYIWQLFIGIGIVQYAIAQHILHVPLSHRLCDLYSPILKGVVAYDAQFLTANYSDSNLPILPSNCPDSRDNIYRIGIYRNSDNALIGGGSHREVIE